MGNLIPKIPLNRWIESLVGWLDDNLEWFFNGIKEVIGFIVDSFAALFMVIPPIVLILIFAALAWKLASKGIGITIFLGLLLVDNLGYWDNTMLTLSLVVTASLISIIIGIPMGIWSARNNTVRSIVTPVLDFMQTMPAFVYLIPAVFFFGTGEVPGIIASVIFAMPPTIRLTNLGIRQVPRELIEASDAFGSTSRQKLFKVQLPIAKSTIMAGINQSIMLSLSMVVIGAMIGAKGLGVDVYRAVTRIRIGEGFEAGLAVVILAIMLDRITQNLGKKK